MEESREKRSTAKRSAGGGYIRQCELRLARDVELIGVSNGHSHWQRAEWHPATAFLRAMSNYGRITGKTAPTRASWALA